MVEHAKKKPVMFKTRLGVLTILFGCAFLVVAGRLFQLQVLRYQQYIALATRDHGIDQVVPARRGDIVDRYGEPVAEDRPSYDISVRADRLKFKYVDVDAIIGLGKKYRGPQNRDENYAAVMKQLRAQREADLSRLTLRLNEEPFVHELARTLNKDENDIIDGLQKALETVARDWASPRTPLRIAGGVDEKTWLGLRAVHEDAFHDARQIFGAAAEKMEGAAAPPFPGLVCTISTRRIYPHGSLGCFVLGHLGELSPAEEESLRRDGLLLEHPQAAERWAALRDAMNDETAFKLEQMLHADPRDVEDIGQLCALISRLTPDARRTVAALGLGGPVAWSERPPRMKLTEPEQLWLGVGLPPSSKRNVLPNRTIGEMGIERFYNDPLRGKSGMKMIKGVLVSNDDENDDNFSFRGNSRPREGDSIALTISLAWQEAAENALKAQDRPGAIVVMDIKSGEILALASWPDFDPNLFAPPRDGAQRQEALVALLKDPRKPLLNRAVCEQYPLGSVMKTLIAAVGLEKGVVSLNETFECHGYITEGGQRFRCDESRSHGNVNLLKGIRCSCNVTFHQIGARIGVENLAPYARLIFGKKTGLDLPREVPGIFPDRAWRTKAYSNNPAARVWTRGNEYQLAIGQGMMTSTVMQAAVLMAAVGNGGYVVTPRLWLDGHPAPARSLGISPANIAVVRQGLEEVVNIGRPGERGTAYSPFHEQGPELPFRVAGKTSTAEHKHGVPPHAWFAGYAPAENPQIAFAVLLEEAGHGGAVAAPVTYRMLKEVYGTRHAPMKNPGGPKQTPAVALNQGQE